MVINQGEVFAINTSLGFGFIQYVGLLDNGVELIRLLEPVKQTNELSQTEVNILERFSIQFLVRVASKKKLIKSVGLFAIPKNYSIPKNARTPHIVKGEFLGWHIVNVKTLKIELKETLSKNDLALSPYGIFNDTLIIEYLEKDWRLEYWK